MRFPAGPWSFFWVLTLASLVLAVIAANVTHDFLFHPRSMLAAPDPAPKGDETPAGSVTLPEGKLATIHLRIEPARQDTLPTEVAVAGRIEVNADRRVAIQSRVSGVIRSVGVSLGEIVKAGQLLVTLDSPDAGSARLNVRARQRELAIARTEAEWKSAVAANVVELVKELRKKKEASDLEQQFAGKPLGSRRADLMATYADLEIAAHEASQKANLRSQNLIGEHPAALAQHTFEGARAKFEAMLEQVSYDAAYQKRLADQQVRQAEAAVVDASHRLRILGAGGPAGAPLEGEDVTAYPIVAPFDGTITAKSAVPSQRAEAGDVLFTLTDLTSVRAVANVPESDFAALGELGGATLRMTVASDPGRTFQARVIYVAPEVDPATRTVRLLAEIANPDGRLKPGMFARIVLDSRQAEPALTVPAPAVVEIDGKPGVFVPDKAARTFVFRPVTPGREVAGRRVIAAGLNPGDRVVSHGAFDLKGELVLANTPEED